MVYDVISYYAILPPAPAGRLALAGPAAAAAAARERIANSEGASLICGFFWEMHICIIYIYTHISKRMN